MEYVAGIASIAGIVSLVGQSLEGIIKLRGFYQDCSDSSSSIRRFLKALNGLIQIHEDVRDLLKKLEDSTAVDRNILVSLQIQIDDCRTDVGLWLKKATAYQPISGSGTRASFRKFTAALERKKIVDVDQAIENHKNNISTQLSVIGRHMDIDQSFALDKIQAKLDQVAESQKLTNSEPIMYWAPKRSFENKPASLNSIASSLNRIEHALGSQHGSFGSTRSQCSFGPPRAYAPFADNDTPFFSASEDLPSSAMKPLVPVQFYRCSWKSCMSSFSSAADLRTHDRQIHDMHWKEADPFLCVYEYCENSLPGKSFPHYTDLQDHLRGVHNDNKPPEILTKESSFRDLDSYFVEKLESCLSSQMNEYIRLILIRSTLKHSHEGLASLRWLFSEKTEGDDSFHDIESLSMKVTHRVQSDIDRIRDTCWKAGQNVDDVDIILKVRDGYTATTSWEPPRKQDDAPVFQERLEGERIKIGPSKMDRINLWLLENLLASPGETTRHRSYFADNIHENSQEWGRAVLKYWLLDGAAIEQTGQTVSTNGAVDSAGMCHSARVGFENDLSLPIVH